METPVKSSFLVYQLITALRVLLFVSLLFFTQQAFAQTSNETQNIQSRLSVDWALFTDSPQSTLDSFFRLSQELESVVKSYEADKSRGGAERVSLATEHLVSLIDLSQIAAIAKRDKGTETAAALLDVFGRIGYPDAQLAPDFKQVRTDGIVSYPIPTTPFRVVLIAEGPQTGEWLFERRTVETAPLFLVGLSDLPLKSRLSIESWSVGLKQVTGPMIPDAVVAAVPSWMKQSVFGTPIWKGLAALVITALAVLLLVLFQRILPKPAPDEKNSGAMFARALGPLGVIVVVLGVYRFFNTQLNLSGPLAVTAGIMQSIIFWSSCAWGFWLLVLAFSERVMEKTDFAEGGIDANMLRLCSHILGFVGCVIILAFGAQQIGLPVLSILAGLGVGSIAIALAVRPTLENLVGGIILYLDKPIRVGEYCSFGEKSGSVEKIGARSVQIRSMDRSTTTIPNARFADMEIINWSKCDRMHLNQTIGLRYETENDQVQYILAKIRQMFHEHPKIDGSSARAMFSGYSETSLNITIMAYVNTPYWSEYFAVREDALLRIKEIIENSGTYYAVPTRTVYYRKDEGLNKEHGARVKKELEEWRNEGEFPFPNFSEDAVESFKGRIEYPVPGSPDYAEALKESPDSENGKAPMGPEDPDDSGGEPDGLLDGRMAKK